MDSNHDIVPTLRMFDGLMMNRAADEIEALRAEVARLKAASTAKVGDVNTVSKLLRAAWDAAEPNHSITQYPESYLATFADMARAVIAAYGAPAKVGGDACERCGEPSDMHTGTYWCDNQSFVKVGGDGREAFERKFPMPKECIWTGIGYAATGYGAWDAHKHAERWEGWQAHAALSSDGGDTKRLDFLIEQQAWVQWEERDGTIRQCQVWSQDHDENYHILSGDSRYFNTPREAIDAAIAAKAKGEAL